MSILHKFLDQKLCVLLSVIRKESIRLHIVVTLFQHVFKHVITPVILKKQNTWTYLTNHKTSNIKSLTD